MTALAVSCTSQRSGEERVFARIGVREVKASHVRLRQAFLKVENAAIETTEERAFSQLALAWLQAEVLAKHGRPVTADLLRAEQQRIERSSRLPQKLLQYKETLGEGLPEIYVLPVYVAREAYFGLFQSLKMPQDYSSWLREQSASIPISCLSTLCETWLAALRAN